MLVIVFSTGLYCLLDSVIHEQVVIPIEEDATMLTRPLET